MQKLKYFMINLFYFYNKSILKSLGRIIWTYLSQKINYI